jgi:hypothetical protein
MLFMVIEQVRGGDPAPVGARFRERGRMMPPDVESINSWLDPDRMRCCQVMRAPDRRALQPRIDAWSDLVDFEVIPVQTSADFWASRSVV